LLWRQLATCPACLCTSDRPSNPKSPSPRWDLSSPCEEPCHANSLGTEAPAWGRRDRHDTGSPLALCVERGSCLRQHALEPFAVDELDATPSRELFGRFRERPRRDHVTPDGSAKRHDAGQLANDFNRPATSHSSKPPVLRLEGPVSGAKSTARSWPILLKNSVLRLRLTIAA